MQNIEKPDALSDVEYHKVKQHTQKGYEYLKANGMNNEIALSIIRYHHERFDGDGYPTALKGNDIPRSAQLTSICDIYSALITDRSYRKAATHADAIKIMREEAANGAINIELFNKFEDVMGAYNSN